MSNQANEQVMVVKTEDFRSIGLFQGYKEWHEYFDLIQSGFFIDRELAEVSPEYKQLIPYIVVMKDGKYLSYLRDKSGGEKRLTSKRSIGFGGHVNPVDGFENALSVGCARELEEELGLKYYTLQIKGLINDDSNDVGKVHLGLVYFAEVTTEPVSHCKSVVDLRFETAESLKKDENLYENWSNIVVQSIVSV